MIPVLPGGQMLIHVPPWRLIDGWFPPSSIRRGRTDGRGKAMPGPRPGLAPLALLGLGSLAWAERRRVGLRAGQNLVPNSSNALQALRRWRQRPKTQEAPLPKPTESKSLHSWRGNRWRLSEKSLPSCVATWHAWMKSMDSEEFFQLVSEKPNLLPQYLEMAKEEGMAGPGNDICVQTSDFVLKHLPRDSPRRVVDLGCGDAALQAELQRRVPELEVTSVDAAALGPGVVVQNLGALPEDWADAFQVAVLCRALWSMDYGKVLGEARRVLAKSAAARLVVVEPFRRWWGRGTQDEKHENQLVNALQRAGFHLFLEESINLTPEDEGMKGVFQFLVASPVSPG
ncbi:unnamed protein product [Effrenium voratum]|nr:unnamed protein product [Effrenium voratum]